MVLLIPLPSAPGVGIGIQWALRHLLNENTAGGVLGSDWPMAVRALAQAQSVQARREIQRNILLSRMPDRPFSSTLEASPRSSLSNAPLGPAPTDQLAKANVFVSCVCAQQPWGVPVFLKELGETGRQEAQCRAHEEFPGGGQPRLQLLCHSEAGETSNLF